MRNNKSNGSRASRARGFMALFAVLAMGLGLLSARASRSASSRRRHRAGKWFRLHGAHRLAGQFSFRPLYLDRALTGSPLGSTAKRAIVE
jgi:hypothetical protein